MSYHYHELNRFWTLLKQLSGGIFEWYCHTRDVYFVSYLLSKISRIFASLALYSNTLKQAWRARYVELGTSFKIREWRLHGLA